MKMNRMFALFGALIAMAATAFATDIGPPAAKGHSVTTLPVELSLYSVVSEAGPKRYISGPVVTDSEAKRADVLAFRAQPFAIPSIRKALQSEPPTSNWSGAWVYRLSGEKEDRASAGVLTKITPLTGVGGKFTLSLDGYAGVSLRKSIPVAAVMAGAELKLADQLRLGLHAGAIIAQNQPTGPCVGASLNLKFAGF